MSGSSDGPQYIYKQVKESGKHIEDLARQFLQNVCQSTDSINENVQLITSVLASMNDGLIVVDANNNLILTNEVAARLAGIDRDADLLTQLKEHYKFYTSTSGHRIPLGHGSIERTLRSETPHVSEVFVRSDRVRPEGAWFRLSSAPIFRSNGSVQGTVTVFQDISTAKSALRRVKELYNTAPCGYHSLSPTGVFLEINKTEIGWLGRPYDALIQKAKFADFLTSASRTDFETHFALLESKGSVSNIELELVGLDGLVKNVLWSSTAVTDQNGTFHSSRCTLFDFTERRRLQQEVDALAALIAHDIKNHLVATAGVIELISDDLDSKLSDESRAVIKTLQTSNQDQLQALNNLINLWAAGERMPPEEVDVSEFIEDASRLVGELARLRNIKINIKADNNLPRIWVPPTALRHVLCNLLHNAIKFSKPGEAVDVVAHTEDGGVTLVISDKGPGISKREKENLFKVRTGKKPAGFSSGLGLYLCRQIVEAAGGRIRCESEEGKGTRFFLHLKSKPRSKAPAVEYSI